MSRREDQVIQFDDYLDGLATAAGARPRGPADAVSRPAGTRRPAIEESDSVLDLLRASLPRFHPSFVFEERLAGTLRSAADAQRPIRASSPDGAGPGLLLSFDRPGEAAAPATPDEAASRFHRRAILGGLVASSLSVVLPVAAAMLLAWRRARVGQLERPA